MSRRMSATLLLTATLLLLQAVPLSAHGAMVLPPPWQDVDGTYSQERGDGWMGSGVTGYQNDGVLVPDGIPEIIGEEHEGRTWCNAANRDFPGQCSFYARHPWLSPGYAVPYSPCSIFEIEPHTDARTLPGNAQPTRWASGSTVEAEWAIYANHGISLPPEAASTLPTSLLTPIALRASQEVGTSIAYAHFRPLGAGWGSRRGASRSTSSILRSRPWICRM